MRIGTFSCDVTPPLGHPLCGGWIMPATQIVDPQSAHGVVLREDGDDPVVIMAVDWCWVMGEAHETWKRAIAEQVDTLPHRVAIQCVHPHDAVMADPAADRILAAARIEYSTLKGGFFEDVVRRTAAAAGQAARNLRSVSEIGTGQARVEMVACNRRVLGADGKVDRALWRGSSCKSPQARAQPEGLTDPYLKCISFWDGQQALAAMHFYATHPMSYYGKGGVSADFAGLAREQCRKEDAKVHHMYFNGCGGDVSAGKYNDGSPENRPVLMQRIHAAMRSAFAQTRRQPIRSFQWRAQPLHMPMSEEFTRAYFTKAMAAGKDPAVKAGPARVIQGAMGIAWWDRYEAGKKIDLTCLHINDVYMLHLPGEPFVAYQLFAQAEARRLAGASPESRPGEDEAHPSPFVAVAGYGDCSTGYIPTAEAFTQGGYEVTEAWVGPKSEAVLKEHMSKLLAP